jgi:hypothetical protein
MKKLFALAAGICLAIGAACCSAQAESPFAEIDGIMAELSKLTGLAQLKKVEYARIGKGEVKQFLEERVKEAVKPEEIRAEELVLRKFGFVPADFDLKKTMIELLSEQAAAFYDYRKKKLFLIDSSADFVQHSALVHELAHALADQHFHLERFVDTAAKEDDSSLARLAVMEGQATWLMSEYLTQRTGQSLRDSPLLLKLMSRATEVASGQYPVFDRAPLYLRETLLFPYAQGLLFQHAVIEKLDKAGFAEVFRRPPSSTQQILHPEKYFDGVKPARPPLPKVENSRVWRTFTEGDLGELDHAILLKQYAGQEESAGLSPAWRGGYYRLLERKADKRLALAYASEWADEAAAERFFELYKKVLKGKWKTFDVESETGSALAGRGDDGHFLVLREGSRVSSLEGMSEPQRAPAAADALH